MAAEKSTAQIAWQGSAQVRRFQEEMARRRSEEARRIGANIAGLRERHHLTQEAAARKLKVGYRTYQSWEEGTSVPRWPTRERIARFYRVSMEEVNGPPTPKDDGLLVSINRIEGKLDTLIAALAERELEDAAEQEGQLGDSSAEVVDGPESQDEEPPAQGGNLP